MKKEFESNSFIVFNGKKIEGIEIEKNSEGEFIVNLNIEELVPVVDEKQFKKDLHAKWDKISEEPQIPWRYYHRCIELFYLAKRQLNLSKNVAKGNFEDLCDLEKIIGFLEDEVEEIKEELTDYETSCFNPECECGGDDRRYYKIGNKINYQRAREEIGDVAACLVGLLAKLDKMEREKKSG